MIKSFLQTLILRLIKPCLKFESYPEFTDNTKYVFDELIKRGYNKKYYMYWYIHDTKAALVKNGQISFWNPQDKSNLTKYIKHLRYYKKAKAIIQCNQYILPENDDHYCKTFFLTHGSPLKDSRDYYIIPNRIDYVLAASEGLVKPTSFVYKYDINRIVPLGHPRNDVFIEKDIDINALLGTKMNRIIIWYPTYKQHRYGNKTDCKYSIPIIHDTNNLKALNEYLRNMNSLIIVKIHFAQDLSFVNMVNLSNILFIDDDFYKSRDIIPYQFVKSCDALLTDYSSVYYDYTLCDKPIGLIWEDIDEYRKNPGLLPDYEYYTKGGVKIYTIKDLFRFIDDVVNGVDSLKAERRESRDFANYSTDGRNTERVTDFIIEKANL